VHKTIQLRELKTGENCLENPKVKKAKENKTVASEAKGSSKANLLSHGLGQVDILLVLDDLNIPADQLEHLKGTVKMSADKISKMYVDFRKSGNSKDDTIDSVKELTKVLNDCNVFEAVMLKWNGNDPTSNKHWDICKKDEAFMNELCGSLFKAFDIDGDGKISFEELCGSLFYLLEGNKDDALRMRFRSIDTDRSGFIDMKEAVVLGGKTMAIIRVSFMLGIRQQSRDLVQAGLKESDFLPIVDAVDDAFKQNSYPEKEAKLLFKYADKDIDGKISEDEYINFMKDEAAQAERSREIDLIMKPVLASITKNVQAAVLKMITRLGR